MGRGRRSDYDPLAATPAPRWLVARDTRQGRQVVEVQPLEPMCDLRRALTAAREARIRDGWTAGDIGRMTSFFFCWRGTGEEAEKLEIGIEHYDPALPRNPPTNRFYCQGQEEGE